ncbi:MAG: ATP synthase F1 subunit delta [Prolixibacteraceae bacterium]|nr:ATP synthase F1 subunit delta [Prolixibacteraceae bacterium]
MDISTINVRYAKAFFSTAKEKKLLDTFKADIQLIYEVCNSSTDFILLLESPVVKVSKKEKLIAEIFKGKVHEFTLNFLVLIVRNRREAYIPGICRNFLDLTRKDQNIKSVLLVTAVEVQSSILEKISTLLEKQLKSKIEIKGKVDENIIGGMILRLDDIQYDASVATQIKKVKQNLLESELN